MTFEAMDSVCMRTQVNKKEDKPNFPPALLTKDQAAYYLGISPRSLSQLVAEGRINPVVHNPLGHPKFKRSDLDEYVESLEYVN